MCGIVGFFGEEAIKEYQKLLQIGWERLAHRGEDSYGVIIKTSEKVIAYKSISKEALLEKVASEEGKEFKKEEIQWILGHNRKASVGSITVELAHPIHYKDENALVIQNGTKKSLANAFDTGSDTQALALVFTLSRKEAKTRLLDGTGVAFCVKRNRKGDYKLYFHKDESRPLVLQMEKGIIASEPFLEGDWLEIRDIPYAELKGLEDIVKFADKKISYSVVLKQCKLCQREFIGSTKDDYCKECANSLKNYKWSKYSYGYKSSFTNKSKK